jgi:hypothetical protein
MSQDTHHHSGHEEHGTEPKSKTSFSASFWTVIILVGLFIAAINFVNVMGNTSEDEGKKDTHNTEMVKESAANDAAATTAEQPEKTAVDSTAKTLPAADTTKAQK